MTRPKYKFGDLTVPLLKKGGVLLQERGNRTVFLWKFRTRYTKKREETGQG